MYCCCVWYISLAMSWGLVRICPCGICRQSRELLVVGLKYFFVDGFGFGI